MQDENISRILAKDEINQLDNLLVPALSKKYPNFDKSHFPQVFHQT